MSRPERRSSPLDEIQWSQMQAKFDEFYAVTSRTPLVMMMVKESKDLLSPVWTAGLTTAAQHAVFEFVEKALEDIEAELANPTASEHLPTSYASDHTRRRAKIVAIPTEVLSKVPTAYDLLKVAQGHQPRKQWTHTVPVRLFETVVRWLKTVAGGKGAVLNWARRVTDDIPWGQLTPESAVALLDYFHEAYKAMLARAGNTRGYARQRLELGRYLPDKATCERMVKLREDEIRLTTGHRDLPRQNLGHELTPGANPASASASDRRHSDAYASIVHSPWPSPSAPSPATPSPFVAVSRNHQYAPPNSSHSQPVLNNPFDDSVFHLPPHDVGQYDQNYVGHVGPYPPSFDQAFPVDPSAITWVPPAYDATYSLSPAGHILAQHPSLAQSGTTYRWAPGVPLFVAPPPFVHPHSSKRREQQRRSRHHQVNSSRQDGSHFVHNAGHYGPSQLGHAGQIHPDSFGFANHPQQPLPQFDTLFDPSVYPMNPYTGN